MQANKIFVLLNFIVFGIVYIITYEQISEYSLYKKLSEWQIIYFLNMK